MVDVEQARIMVRVQPNAKQNEVLRFKEGVLHLKIAAPPIKGKANQELIRFLSDTLGLRKSNLTIAKGITSNRKTIGITHLTQSQVMEHLERLSERGEKYKNHQTE